MIIDRDERQIAISMSATPLHEDGQISGVIVTFRDITERRAARRRDAGAGRARADPRRRRRLLLQQHRSGLGHAGHRRARGRSPRRLGRGHPQIVRLHRAARRVDLPPRDGLARPGVVVHLPPAARRRRRDHRPGRQHRLSVAHAKPRRVGNDRDRDWKAATTPRR